MKQRGRKSSEAVIANSVDGVRVSCLQPTVELTEEQMRVWQETVEGKPADYFGSEHGALLVEYVCAVCRARVLRGLLEGHCAARASAESLKQWQREFMQLNQMSDRVAGLVEGLARAMRLTHQAYYKAEKVIPKPGRALWQRDAH